MTAGHFRTFVHIIMIVVANVEATCIKEWQDIQAFTAVGKIKI